MERCPGCQRFVFNGIIHRGGFYHRPCYEAVDTAWNQGYRFGLKVS